MTDDDCPFEERTSFIVLDPNLHVRCCRSLGAAYASFVLKDIEWLDDRRFVVMLCGDEGRWLFTLRERSVPYVYPCLGVRRLPAG